MGSLVVLFFAFPVSVALANVMMGLTVLFWLMSMKRAAWMPFFRQAWRNPVVKPAVLLALLVVIASAWSPASGAEIVGYFKKYAKFLILPVFISLLTDGAVRRRCWQGFALAMLITLVSTWLNVWTTLPWSRTDQPGLWCGPHGVQGPHRAGHHDVAVRVPVGDVGAESADPWACRALVGGVPVVGREHSGPVPGAHGVPGRFFCCAGVCPVRTGWAHQVGACAR